MANMKRWDIYFNHEGIHKVVLFDMLPNRLEASFYGVNGDEAKTVSLIVNASDELGAFAVWQEWMAVDHNKDIARRELHRYVTGEEL